MSEIHDRHVRQLELEAEDARKTAAGLTSQIDELAKGRDSLLEKAEETERLLAHMKEAKK